MKIPLLMELARSVSERLPGMRGAMNLQCFLSETGQARIIEINPRFGGGYPLAHRAGAPFAQWLLEETLGGAVAPAFDSWKDQLMMLRYDQEHFVDLQEARQS